MLRSEELKKLILTHQRRLLKLKEQQAVFGASVDPSVLIQIEDIETELARLREELVALPPDEAESDEIITPPVPATRAPKPLNLAEAKPHQGELPLPAALPQPPRAPWPVKQWPWLAGGLMVIGVAVGLLGNQMGGQFFVAPTLTATLTPQPTATATATIEPTATAILTPSPEPFNLATYPKGAVTQTVEVRLWAAPGCDQPILTLNEQIEKSLVELIDSGEVILDDVRPESYLPDTPLGNPNAAGLDIWADCAKSNSMKINFNLGETTGPPPEVYSLSEVSINERSGNPLLGRNIALGLIHYQRRDYAAAAERLASAARETDILGMLYGNSLLFQIPPQSDETGQLYKKAAEAYEKAIKPDTSSDLAAMIYNNRGVALFSQAILVSGYETAIQAFDQAIKLQPKLPWPYFNRAYARFFSDSYYSKEAIADCEQAIQQATANPSEILARAAGYACQVEILLMQSTNNKPNQDHTPEIDRLLGSITPTDYSYPLPYYLRGYLSVQLGMTADACEQYACYAKLMQKQIKLPGDVQRIDIATSLLVQERQPLTCLILNDQSH